MLAESNGSDADALGIRWWTTKELDTDDELVIFADRDDNQHFYAIDPRGEVVLVARRGEPLAPSLEAWVERSVDRRDRDALYVRGESTGRALTPFERDALAEIIRWVPQPFQAVLLEQVRSVSVGRRHWTGAGCYIDLVVAKQAPRISLSSEMFESSVNFERAGTSGFMHLFIREGVVACIEGAIYGDGLWPRNDAPYTFG